MEYEECPECGLLEAFTISSTIMKCSKCGDTIYLESKLCRSCGYWWLHSNAELLNKFEVGSSPKDLTMITSAIKKAIDALDVSGKTMSDSLDVCIRCGAPTLLVGDDKYQCTECDFILEIIKSYE